MATWSKTGVADEVPSPNYAYLVERLTRFAAQHAASDQPFRALDYGCGHGITVAEARRRGLEVDGADTFDGIYADWRKGIEPDAAAHVSHIANGRIEAPDAHYNVVVSNQVFEHIEHPQGALSEIARVLKPGGTFLALFPTADIWFEGHVGLYVVHWLSPWPALQNKYLRAMSSLGFGYYRGTSTPETWSEHMQRTLREDVFYHGMHDVDRWCREVFHAAPVSEARDYMRFRLQRSRFSALSWLADTVPFDALLGFVCRVRAGRVLAVRKPAIRQIE